MTRNRIALSAFCALAALCTAPTSQAIEPLPRNPGWNGFVNPSFITMRFRDNQIAGAGLLDVGNKRIDSLDDKPESKTINSIALAGELGYLFERPRLYVFLGNRLEDMLSLDNSSALGVRKDIETLGTFEGSLLFSSIPTEVWEDPFLTGVDRKETDRDSAGGRIGLANILGSTFNAQATFRAVDIDDERSGATLALTDPERALLDRNGDLSRFSIEYNWTLNPRHILVPSLSYSRFDADGDAMANDRIGFQLSHVYIAGRYRLVSNLILRQVDYDEVNPVFGEKQDEDDVVLSVTGLYTRFLEVDNLSLMSTLVYAESNSDINFYDSEAALASVGVLYRF